MLTLYSKKGVFIMNYDFDHPLDRLHTNCYKVDAKAYYNMPEDVLSLWVADMDFATAPCVQEAIVKRTSHPIYGYTFIPDAYYDAIIHWMHSRHNWLIQKDWIVPTPNILCGMYMALQTFLSKGDKVIIQKPVYNNFETAILNSGCVPINNALLYKEGTYTINFEDLEEKLKDPKVKAFILCNPHNPVGRVWTKKELTQLGKLCVQYNVLILSDEIHHDLIYSHAQHTSMGNLSPEILNQLIVCTSPSKTFNLSGISSANFIIANPSIRKQFTAQLNCLSLHNLSPLAIDSLIAAYTKGAEWVDALISYLEANRNAALNFIKKELPLLKVTPCEGTYLLWIDMSALPYSQDELMTFLSQKAKLWLNAGTTYDSDHTGFVRLNFAVPKAVLEKALNQLKAAFDA